MATSIEIDPARQLAAAEHDLVDTFPEEPAAEIHTMVVRENRRYDSAHVRDFISILVMRRVRARLLTRAESRRLSSSDGR